MATVVQCSNSTCCRTSHLGDDPLGRIFRCPRCLTKLPTTGASTSDSGWTKVLGPLPRRGLSTSFERLATAEVELRERCGVLSRQDRLFTRVDSSHGPQSQLAWFDSGEYQFGAMSDQSSDPWNVEIRTNPNLQESSEVVVGPFRREECSGWDSQTHGSPNGFTSSSDVENHSRPHCLELQKASLSILDAGRLGRFQILEILGEGRHATVYRAFDPLLERYVALKIPRGCETPSARVIERFLGEARALARLSHPRIVPIFEAGYDGNRHYISMGLIDGRGLAELLTDGPLPCYRAAEIIAELAEAVGHAHGLGIIHRDIKPANIRLDHQGLAYLMDFGIAYRHDSGELLATTGAIHGTPAYLAPEQAKGPRTEDLVASDQYSLGVVMYEILCGKPPFVGSPSSVLFRAIHDHPVSPRAINPEVPRSLAMICQKAMAKRPDQRYPSCGALAIQLRAWLQARSSSSWQGWVRLRP